MQLIYDLMVESIITIIFILTAIYFFKYLVVDCLIVVSYYNLYVNQINSGKYLYLVN